MQVSTRNVDPAFVAASADDVSITGGSAPGQQPCRAELEHFRSGRDAAANPVFDEELFPEFAPLLSASREYARQSGFRFRSDTFDGIDVGPSGSDASPIVDEAQCRDPDLGLAGKIRAAPAVRAFTCRLVAGDPSLVEEIDRAFRIISLECNRNVMISLCKEVGMFPPSPSPVVDEEDCFYEDLSASLPVIAQRLYNDEVKRLCDGTSRMKLRALTAAYLLDFAEQVGASLPQTSKVDQSASNEFAVRTAEWTACHNMSVEVGARDAFHTSFDRLGDSLVRLRKEAQSLWSTSSETLLCCAVRERHAPLSSEFHAARSQKQ